MSVQQPMERVRAAITAFIGLEAASGIALLAVALLALAASNSPIAPLYRQALELPVGIRIGTFALDKPLLLWINDGLMAVFFLLVGLEIKRELIEGELSSPAQAALPAISALGGMAVPALVYAAINWGDATALRGWAIPAATDIAFALGVLSLLGSRVPSSLKVFLVALAILDDLGAIVIIAIFYTSELSYLSLGLAVAVLVSLALLNLLGVTRITPYALLGIVLWVCVLKSGVHATLAGVAIALAIPIAATDTPERSPLRDLEQALHPWVAYLVMPVFAFANAGVSFTGLSWSAATAGIPLGVALGLFLGKQAGAFGAAWLAVRLGLARLPDGATWPLLYGTCVLAGIGFTMSLFIGTLAFEGVEQMAQMRLGVLAGSLVSGIVGFAILHALTRRATASV